ncbi:superoxide dismutase [Fe] [Gracilibacillus boraciitolerans JCM 21714]|uniref:superoxide dismutase n=1 Tax=Gracilibacillus boraciitolerans JCM 21714 TaxID=1298598 RepID=W4VFK7_9BACI|nr:superoxide dismutase [Gracilibacillus boraciitolerans]GAE91972.1 superoxide dismutase [Fe] [Gracilibacillus boraciitolerans JCM 21714]
MDKEYQNYLESLIEWGGEKVKNKIQESSLPEEEKQHAIQQVVIWQNNIYEILKQEESDIDIDRLEDLRLAGENIFQEMRQPQTKDSVPYGKHQLPALPYQYNALEPYISEQIMRLHHTKHHQSYVNGLNKAEKALYIDKKDPPIKHWLREQAFHGSGHYLHTIFWFNMTPNSKKQPSGEILQQINKDFGSWNSFKKLFTDIAKSVEGNGWAVLVWSPRSGKLAIQSYEKHQFFQLPDTIPLLVLDVWEHAYYLQHQTDKVAYINNWWNVVNWDNVNDRFEEAKKLKWTLF